MQEWTDNQTQVAQAHKLYDRGQWREAAALLRSVIRSDPHNASWYFNLGLTLSAMGDHSAACQAYKSASVLTPEDVETLNCLGVSLTRLGKYAESLATFERIQNLDSNYEPSYCNRIVAYTEIGRHDEAELMFYLARQLVEDCPLCYFNIGNSHYVRGNYAHAIDCWRQTLRIDEKHGQTHSRIADAYWARGNLPKALEHYRAELAITGQCEETLQDIAEVLREMKLAAPKPTRTGLRSLCQKLKTKLSPR
ncbi:MAG: hypothetical protein DRP83_02860 [Planctomycetota bacterium]|nr:MAG: hypothetical protein DRP83_02860 [Planctomycetota bacterium]